MTKAATRVYVSCMLDHDEIDPHILDVHISLAEAKERIVEQYNKVTGENITLKDFDFAHYYDADDESYVCVFRDYEVTFKIQPKNVR